MLFYYYKKLPLCSLSRLTFIKSIDLTGAVSMPNITVKTTSLYHQILPIQDPHRNSFFCNLWLSVIDFVHSKPIKFVEFDESNTESLTLCQDITVNEFILNN